MRVLVVGGGGREHALSWALAASPSVDAVVCAPGNAGIADVATVRPLHADDPAAVVALAQEEAVDLVVVGPEAPLVAGVADALGSAGVAVFGPTAAAVRIEASKSFAKEVMASAGVPTAGYVATADPREAREALRRFGAPHVVKADGLAAGKGVVVTSDLAAAERAVDAALVDGVFGDAGARVVVEEFLDGPEVSLFGLCDGSVAVPLVPAQDHKRAHDGDAGPNTGGMGASSPVPGVGDDLVERMRAQALQPVVDELARRGTPFSGVLYAGLVLTPDGPKVLEYNARFGDPETQVVLPRLRSDLGELLLGAARGDLASCRPLRWEERAAVTVVLASGGYPGTYEVGRAISGLAQAAAAPDALVFHAGTRFAPDGSGAVETAGGRVLAVTGLGPDVAAARAAAYRAADLISFEGLHRRSDIAAAGRR